VMALLLFSVESPVRVAGQQVAIEVAPTFLCNLMDSRALALGIRGADLGVSVVVGSELWLMFGDTRGTGPGPPSGGQPVIGSSSAIESTLPFDCSSYSWLTSAGKFYQPLHSTREIGVDESTVPAGAITLDGTTYIFSMRVNQWGANSEGTHAHGVLFRGNANRTFAELTQWPEDQLFVNTAPLAAQLPDGTPAVFLATSALYRHSPIYLAYVVPSKMGNPSAYHYLTGYDQNGSPVWSSEMSEAKPLPGLETVWAGELSFLYDAPLNSYLLMFKDYSNLPTDDEYPPFELYSSSTPYGPFQGPLTFYPCGTSSPPSWMKSGWGRCYGGYMLPDSFGADGSDLHFVVSLWDPYTTVLMTMRLTNTITTESTSQIASKSGIGAHAPRAAAGTGYSVALLSFSIASTKTSALKTDVAGQPHDMYGGSNLAF